MNEELTKKAKRPPGGVIVGTNYVRKGELIIPVPSSQAKNLIRKLQKRKQ